MPHSCRGGSWAAFRLQSKTWEYPIDCVDTFDTCRSLQVGLQDASLDIRASCGASSHLFDRMIGGSDPGGIGVVQDGTRRIDVEVRDWGSRFVGAKGFQRQEIGNGFAITSSLQTESIA